MALRAHHERRHSVIGILALIAQVGLVARHTIVSGGTVQLRIRSIGDFYQRLFEVGVTGADTFREPADGFSMTDAGSFPRALRTDSVNRGSSISLFTLESVVLALFAGFFLLCMVECSHGPFAASVLNSSHRILIEIHDLCLG